MLFFDFAMLLPLIAFVMGCLVFVGIGLIVLSRDIPKMRLTFVNLLLFVVGAFLGTFALELLYGRIFADAGNHLRNTVVVFGQIPVMLIGAVGGGAGTVCLRTRIKLIAGLFLLVLIAGGFWFLYAPAHWLTPFTGTVTVDERPTPADLYIGNPTDSEAQAIAFVHVPGVGDYFLNFEAEKYARLLARSLCASNAACGPLHQ